MASLPLLHPLPASPAPNPDLLPSNPKHNPSWRRADLPFDSIPHRDVVSWTTSIARHCRNGRLPEAVETFSSMNLAGVHPNHVTLVTFLSACADDCAGAFALGLSLHGYAYKLGFDAEDVRLGTAVVDMYAKGGRMDLAGKVFDEMTVKNSVTFNTMIDGYVRNGDLDKAVMMFDSMPRRDKVSWTALIGGLVRNGLFEEAIECFREMQIARVDIDYVTLIMVLAACANLGAVGSGLWVHRYALSKDLLSNVRLGNSLVDMYARCGFIDLASQVFSQMRKRTRVSWNSIIVGFAINGRGEDALKHFSLMEDAGFRPDGVTFTGVLTACSHAGFIDEGLRHYDEMQRVYGISPRIEHYGCLVDLLSRVGRLEDALDVIKNMLMKPNEVILGSLLAACSVHGDISLAEKLMGFLLELEPDTDSNYVLLSNIYAKVGRWDRVGGVRMAMKEHGIRKNPGISSIEIEGCVSEFVAGDRSHQNFGEIRTVLDQLTLETKCYGYLPQSFMGQPIEHD